MIAWAFAHPVVGCHAGAGHGSACDHGPWGRLCAECWRRCEVLLKRLRPGPLRETEDPR